jgi:adenosylcobinamide-phosphate synthase
MDLAILFAAVILDLVAGEPPNRIHPTVWFGKTIGFFDCKWKRRNPALDFTSGFFSVMFVILLAFLLASLPALLPSPINYVLGAYFLFSSISIRSMVDHAKITIKNGQILPEKVQMIVSRDTSKLNQAQLSSAVIESVAENFVDGVLAPLFYFAIFGLHGALIYRAINVCDAMVGYKDAKYIYFGKFAARLDDAANFLPARISALLFTVLKPSCIATIRKYRGIKLNGGYPISGMAGVLGVKLEKPGYYVINGKEPGVRDVVRSIGVYWKLCALAIALCAVLILLRYC